MFRTLGRVLSKRDLFSTYAFFVLFFFCELYLQCDISVHETGMLSGASRIRRQPMLHTQLSLSGVVDSTIFLLVQLLTGLNYAGHSTNAHTSTDTDL